MNKTIVAAFLGAVFASTAVLPTFNVHAANGGLISEQTVVHPIRSLMEAQNLALDFVEKRWDKHPQWQSGHLGDVVSLVNSAGKVQAYEVQISDQYLQPIGYVIVEAGLSGAIVAEYACEGYSPSQLLVQAYEKQTGKNIGNSKREMQMLYSGPGTSGMAWVNENNERQLRLVRIGDDVGVDGVAVLSGLRAGERVVVKGKEATQDGSKSSWQ